VDVYQTSCDPTLVVHFQRQSGYQVEALRADRGTEYQNLLSAFMKKQGIVHVLRSWAAAHERSSPYTPEQRVTIGL
jgi:hypothetical protein